MKKITLLVISVLSSVTIMFSQEICNNGIDDDGDGLIDYNDTGDCYCTDIPFEVPSLIPNASFEAMNCCPSTFSQMNCAQDWVQASTATSDYMNTCGMIFSAATSAGLYPPDGAGMVGAIFAPTWQEYVGACLLQPLMANNSYTLQFSIASTPISDVGDVCNGGVINYGPIVITLFGNPNCNNLPFSGTGCPPSPWQVIGTATYTPVSSWSIIEINFTPTVNINAVILGSPCTLPGDYTYGPCYPYFYYDNLVLNQSSTFAADIIQSGYWCNNDVLLTGSFSTTGVTYQWCFDDVALPGQTGINLDISGNSLPAGNYSLVTTYNGSCNISYTTVVDVATPVSNAGPDASVCQLTTVLAAVPSTGSGTWTLNTGPGTASFMSPNSPASSVTVSTQGTYIFTWTEDNGGCIDSDDVTVTFTEQPVADAGTDNSVCQFTYQLNATPSVGTGTWSLTSGPGTASFQLPNSPTSSVTVSFEGTYIFTWTEDNGNGCIDSDDVTVIFTQVPSADAGPDDAICGTTYTLSGTPGSIGSTLLWTYTGPGTATITSPTLASTNVTVSDYGTFTFIFTETVGPGCTDSDTVLITFNQTMNASAGADDGTCGSTFSLSATPSNNGTWSMVSGPGAVTSWGAGQTVANTDVTVSLYGSYTFAWSVNSSGCTDADTVIITFVEQPLANAGTDGNECGLVHTMNAVAGTGTGTWSLLAGAPGSVTSWGTGQSNPDATVTVNNYGAYSFLWTLNNNGCTDADTVIVNFNQSPVSNAGADDDTCALTYTLNATPTNNGIWNMLSGPGNVTSWGSGQSGANTSATVSQQGNYSFAWLVTDANGCFDADTVVISFNLQPTANAGYGGSECDLNFNLNAAAGIGTGTWSLLSGAPGFVTSWGTGINSPNTVVTVSTYGTYMFGWALDNNGCTDSDTITVNFYQQPVANAGPDMTECDMTVNLQATPSVGTGTWTMTTGPGTVTWNPNQSSPSAIVTAGANGTYQFTWTEVNQSICTSSDNVTVNFSQPPLISFLSSNESCYNSCDGSITASVTGLSPQYLWNTNPPQITQTATGLCAGVYCVTVSDIYGCTSVKCDTLEPRVPIVITNITTAEPSCFGYTNGEITVYPEGGTGTGTFTYHWNDATGQITQTAVNLPAGTYTVTITDANNCTLTSTTAIDQPDEILLSVNQPATLCNGQSATLTANTQNGTAPYFYQWTVPPSLTVISTEQFVQIAPTSQTTYNVQVTDNNGCPADLVSVTVFVLPELTIQLTCDEPYVCPGSAAVITIQPGGGNGGPYYVFQNVGPDQFSVGTTLSFVPEDDTVIYITVKDECTQPVQASIPIYVYERPAVILTAMPSVQCQPATIRFYSTSGTTGLTYLWNFGDDSENSISVNQNPEHVYEDYGVFSVTLQVTTPEGCVFYYPENDFNITVYRTPVAKFEADDTEANLLKPVVYFTNNSILITDEFQWDFGDGSGSDEIDPVHVYSEEPDEYTVELIAINPDHRVCADTIWYTVEVRDVFTFYAPSAFVPENGSPSNNIFKVFGHGIDENNFHLLIYDRWGEKIFESFNYDHGWDGTVKNGGKQAPNGVYTWVVIFKDLQQNQHQYTGAVTLIR